MSHTACKKCEEEECECPEWIFTLADLIMVMMGLFVILWVLKQSPSDGSNMQLPVEVVAAIRESFDYLPDPNSQNPVDIYMIMQKLGRPLKSPGQGGETTTPRQGAEGTDPEVTSVRPGKQAIVGTRVRFEAGRSDLGPEALQALDQIAMLIRGHRNVVLIKGHAALDDLPEGADAQARMDLSLRRAQIVADHLVAHGVAPEILRVQGCSTF